MNTKDAASIIDTLIKGHDPESGEDLPPETVLHRASVIRALLVAKAAMESVNARKARRDLLPQCVGQTWSPEEEERLATAYKNGATIAALAKDHMRTERAIEARLIRLGLREVTDATKEPFFPQ
jgi:hypothetical protein